VTAVPLMRMLRPMSPAEASGPMLIVLPVGLVTSAGR
jgi:hypothetical protein